VTLPASAEAHGDVAPAALRPRPRRKNRSRRRDLLPTIAYRLGRYFVHHYVVRRFVVVGDDTGASAKQKQALCAVSPPHHSCLFVQSAHGSELYSNVGRYIFEAGVRNT
jgi:hypothetical protein